ncbi:MAG: type II secretion system secretin GspD [Bradymonadaceae bacterium]|nr:type II secretion system secretin GspD [Lujinxingiaceae bacterium]
MAKTPHRSGHRRALSALLAALVGATTSLAAPMVFAQDASTERPGVINRGGEEQDEPTPPPRGTTTTPPARTGTQRQVITPENASSSETFNLPPNFDPSYRARRTPGNVKVTIDFRQANLEEVVKFFSGAMNLNFIVADSLKANKTITIISPTEVTIDEAYRAFLAALEMNGLTIVPMGNFLKIVESQNAISEPMTPYEAGDTIPNEARMVTAIVPVENAKIDEVTEILTKFASKSASIIPYHSSLIITENAANLRRLQALVKRLDKGEAVNNVYVYKVLYADAQEVAQKLKEVFEGGQSGTAGRAAAQQPRARQTAAQRRAAAQQTSAPEAGGGGGGSDSDVVISEIISDDRTNQLIIITNQRSFERIREMIDILDVPTAVGGQIHVKFLEYASAEDLASTLSSLASGVQAGQRGRGQTTAAPRQAPPTRGQAGGQENVASLLSGEVQITAHKATNALVVVASPRDYLSLENVINMLDRPRRQVYVEAVIMEIGLDVNRKIGVGFNAGLGQDFDALIPSQAIESGLVDDTRGLILGQSNYQGIEQALGGAGGALGLLGPLVQIPGTSISLPAFALLLQATQTDNSVNILSTPAILTMDNEEAEIVVGERVPFLRGIGGGGGGGLSNLIGSLGAGAGGAGAAGLAGLAGLGGLGGLISPIEYEDVGITLRILPQVNESSYVRLEVDQEVSDIKGAGGLGAGAPIRTRRNAKTTVLVKDQSTVVIGGLIRDVENDTIEKVPFLGDIPLIGMLFRNTSTITTKQNLVLMLTPYIIESEADLKKIYDRKIEERRELLKLFGKRNLDYMKQVNFQKKSGLVERMRRQIGTASNEDQARREALEAFEEGGPRYRILGSNPETIEAQGRRGRRQQEVEQEADPQPRPQIEVQDLDVVE